MKYYAKKRFGQNFLVDQNVLNKIVAFISPTSEDFIVEIGPGMGALTSVLLEHINQLNVIEIDTDLVSYLKTKFLNKLIIHSIDVLKFDFNQFEATDIKVIGNLPYNISTPLLFSMIQYNNIREMYFVLQKEVVDRICAFHNTKEYGKLSIMMQCKFKCIKLLDIHSESFMPKPKVASALVKLIPLTDKLDNDINDKTLYSIVNNAFNKRRKTIGNSLKCLFSVEELKLNNIDVNQRAENLSIYQYIALSKYLDSK